jgi:hypothetical protein
LKSIKGGYSNQPLKVLNSQHQSGNQNDWGEYAGDFCPVANQIEFSWLMLSEDLDGTFRLDCQAEYP